MFHCHCRAVRYVLPLVLAIFVASSVQVQAQDFFDTDRDFIIDTPCDATRSIHSGGDPTPLQVSQSVPGRGVNKKSAPTHVFVRIGNANKWVSLGCGHFADGQGPTLASGPNGGNGEPNNCLPFFDNDDNKVNIKDGQQADVSPAPPTLNDFDRALSAVCGPPGHEVEESEFKNLMQAHPEVLTRLQTFTAGKVFADRPARTSTAAYLSDLTEAWFEVDAFDHIICGEPSPAATGGKIGGLHFHGRYLQLQVDGNACRLNNHKQNEVTPQVIYTIGVAMKNTHGRFVQDSKKGYGLTLSGEDLLKVITRAFTENPTTSTGSSGCWLPVSDDGHQFTTVFVRRKAGIRTFFPDATPRGPGDRMNPDCTARIELQ